MGDELGDFFARKDKGKKKGKKSKFTTTDQILQHAETQVQQQTERESAANAPAPLRPARRTKEDEEWKDFAEEHVPDLSGLKLQSMSKLKQAQGEQGENVETTQDGEERGSDAEEDAARPAAPKTKAHTSAGGKVWATEEDEDSDREFPVASASEPTVASSTADSSTAATSSQAPAAGAAGGSPTTGNVSGGKYVPPSQRRAVTGQSMDTSTMDGPSASASAGKYVPPSQRRAMEAAASQPRSLQPMQLSGRRGGRNTAPDVNSDEAFPSLQAVTTGGSSGPTQRVPGFSEVHRGASAPSHSQQKSGGVSLENRYNNLR